MRRRALIILATLLMMAAGVDASAQPPAPKTPQPSTKLVRNAPWRDFKVRLLVPDPSGAKSAIVEVDAKHHSYHIPGAGYSFRIVVLYDPHKKRTCVVPGIGGSRAFYVSADTGMLGVLLGPDDGALQWARSFVEIPGPSLDLDEAERRFEREFDEAKASQHLARAVSLDVTRAIGSDFFDQPASGRTPLDVRPEMAGSYLHLDLANPGMAKTAGLWIDLKGSRIVRAIDTRGLERRDVDSRRIWTTTAVKLMHSSANGSGATSQPIEVMARWAQFYVLGTNEHFSVFAVTDPATKRVVFLNGAEYVVSTSTGLMGVSIFGGVVTVRRRVLEMSGNGDISATLNRFAAAFDPAALRRAERDDIRIHVLGIIGDRFINGSSQPLFPRVEHVGMSDGILHFVLVHPGTGQRAACRVDIRPGSVFLQRVVRVEVEGEVRPIPSPWVDGKARLVTPGHPARLEELREVDARYANLLESEPRLAVVHDAPNKTISIVDGFRDYYRSQNTVRRNSALTFYVPRADGLLGVIVYAGGIEFQPAYFVAIASAGGTDAAIALFDRSFDRDAFERQMAGRKVTVNIAEAIGQDVFFDPVNKQRIAPRVDVIDLQGSVLRLVLTNPTSQRTVTLWFDVNTCQLIRSSIEGRLVLQDLLTNKTRTVH